MKSYTETLTLLQKATKISAQDISNNSFLMTLFNDSISTICNIRGGTWWFLEAPRLVLTQAGNSFYNFPAGLRKITNLYVTVGTTIYRPQPVYDQATWAEILSANLNNSDIPLYYKMEGSNSIRLYPAPITAGNIITITGRLTTQNLLTLDYTTGSILSITNGANFSTVTGTGTTWNSSMSGKFIRINSSGLANAGDNKWYKILSVNSATSLSIVLYEGPVISAGSATYTIADTTIIPEAYDMAPIYRTLALYNQINDPLNGQVSERYWRLYDGGNEAGLSRVVGGLIGQMLENEGASIENTYMSPNDIGNVDPNYPPRSASGFI